MPVGHSAMLALVAVYCPETNIYKVGKRSKHIHRNYSCMENIQKLGVGTLTVGFKCQVKAIAFIRSIRYKVNEEMIVCGLKEGWWD